MENFEEYIKVKTQLINVFLLSMPKNILDISFDFEVENLNLQFVLLKGTVLPDVIKARMEEGLKNFKITTNIIYLTKDEFNESEGSWLHDKYEWLPYLLYSKADTL